MRDLSIVGCMETWRSERWKIAQTPNINKSVGPNLIYLFLEPPAKGRAIAEKRPEGHWEITTINIEPAHRGKKIGSRMIELIEEELRKKRVTRVTIDPRGDDVDVMKSFVGKLGFTKVPNSINLFEKDL